MTLPKGFGGGGGGASRADVESMIGKRIENYTSLITLSYLGAFFATMFGTMVGYLYYPWAYASASGHYAMIVLTCLLYTSPSPRDQRGSRMPSSA